MSSTDEKALRRFFVKRLVPVAEALRRKGVRFFPLGPEPEAPTWYQPAPVGEPDFFELSEAEIEAALRERWETLPELAALTGLLLELASRLEVAEQETPEISPFVYVMY